MKVKSHHPGLCVQWTGMKNSQGETLCSDEELRVFFPLRHQATGTTRTADTRMETAPPKWQQQLSGVLHHPKLSISPSQALHSSCVWPVMPLSKIYDTLAFITVAPQECCDYSTVEVSIENKCWSLQVEYCSMDYTSHTLVHTALIMDYGLQVLVCWCNTFHIR